VAAFKASVADSAFVGHVGEKLAFRARLVAMIPCDSAYGRSYVNKFLTDKGESFVWFSKAGTHGPRDLGKAFDVKGTVKAHKEYHGAKETALTRCKLTA
jgi:hypothetical protein